MAVWAPWYSQPLSLFSGALMVVRPGAGWFGIGLQHDPALTTWIVSLVLFPVGALLQYLSSGALHRALERARASEEKYRLITSVSADYTFSTELDDTRGYASQLGGGRIRTHHRLYL